MPSSINQTPDQNNEIRFEIEGNTVLLLTSEGMTYNGQFIQDAGEARQALVTVLTDVIALRKGRLITVEEAQEFAKWSEGIFQEYASLKPDEHDAPEVQAEVNASIEEDRRYLMEFLKLVGLNPEDVDDDEVWIYTAEYLYEIITYGMVEGGYMPDPEVLMAPPGPSRESMLDAARQSIRCHTDAADSGMPLWVIQALRAMLEDEALLLKLYHEVCANGWVQGRQLFEGWAVEGKSPGPPDALQRIRDVRGRYVPLTAPEEPPVDNSVFSEGDYVRYKDGRGVLRCGSGMYVRAVVASMKPFKLISESGDMLWSATVQVEDFEKCGEADRPALLAVMDRLKRELYRDGDQVLGEASL